MSTEESVGIQAKKNLSVGRGRGKTNSQQTATSQSKNNISESKSKSWSKTVVENSLPKRVPRGRGWRRPDQARYVPRALRKENNKENPDSRISKDCREEDKAYLNNRDILSDSDDNGQTCADRQLSTRLHPEEENNAASIASEDEVQEFPGVSNNDKGTDELVNKLFNKLSRSCEQYKSPDVRKELVDIISHIKEDCCLKKNTTGNETVDSKQIKEPIDPQGGTEVPVSVLTEVLEMENSMTSENDSSVKSFPLAESIEDKQYSFRNQDKRDVHRSADSVEQIKVIDTCLSIADSVQENKQQHLIKKTWRENIDSVDQTEITDTCQSKSLVISCVGSDYEKEGQNLLDHNMKESVSLDHQYQEPLIDACQSSSAQGIDKYDADTQHKHKELKSIEYQDLKENSLTSDKDPEMTNILEPKDGANKLLENSSIEDEKSGKDNRQLPMLENLGNISEETQFTETHQLSKCYTEISNELHDASGCCYGDITSMTSSRGDDTLEDESCHSSKSYIEINSELHDANGCCSGDITYMSSSREDDTLETESKADKVHDERHLVRESSSNYVLNKIDSKEVEDDSSCITLRDNPGLREKADNCCKSDVASTEKTCTDAKANFEAEDSIVKNKIQDEIQDDTKQVPENKEVLEKNTETERETSKGYRTLVETINCNENKMNSDGLVSNEKTPETEAKQKKKSKKKKDGEAEARDEKKKKKRKKKESEGDQEESKEKDKEKDEKKLKKKSKKKATKEDSESKSEDSKSKKSLKDKKDKKCKSGTASDADDDDDDDDDESWESKFNEDGDCLEPELLNELTKVTGIKKPSKHKTQFDYYALPSKEVVLDDDDDSGYGHIVELYDFSPELKTQDLVQLLSSFKSQGYDIKWVDDTHALAVFSSEIAAKQAIQMCSSPILKLRPITQGTSESKSKAKKCCSFLQPYKPRPKTTNLAAHRLVTGALGVRSTMSKEDREREREKIKEAKEQKRQEKQRKAEIWGDES